MTVGYDPELARIVHDDLVYLAKEWDQDITEASLRRSSPVLRNLLVDGMLERIAASLGQRIRVLAPLTSKHKKLNLHEIQFYMCGGAKYRGQQIAEVCFYNRAMSPQEIRELHRKEEGYIGKSYPEKLNVFLHQTSFVVEGTAISREVVIKYVSNKLGGAHYDPRRKEKSALERQYALLDKVRRGVMVVDVNSVYYELLSIGQRIVGSRDVAGLHRILRQLLAVEPLR